MLELNGIPTVTVGNMRQRLEMVRPPRTLLVHTPLGATLGAPGDRQQQKAVLEAALGLLTWLPEQAVRAGALRDFGAEEPEAG